MDTASVFFALDDARVAPAAVKTLDSLLYSGWIRPGTPVALIGYADYLGTSGYNDSLSRRRVVAVKAFLLQSGFQERDIRLLLARGEVSRADESNREGSAPDRRVDVVSSPPPEVPARGSKRTDTAPPSAFIVTFEPLPQLPPRPRTPPKRPDSVRKPSLQRAPKASVKNTSPAPVPVTPLTDLLRIDSLATVRLDNLYFPMGRHTPYNESFAELDNLYRTLHANPTLHIRVEGHVCCINGNLVPDALDEETAEYRLSVNRARFITEYLIRKGIPADRLEYAGFGKSRPVVAVEQTAADGDRNRRVEIRVLHR